MLTAEEKKAKKRAAAKARYAKHHDEIRAQQKAYYAANREKRRVYNKAWCEANREKLRMRRVAKREELRAKSKAWFAAHEGYREAYRAKHKEEIRAQTRVYRETHRDASRVYREANHEKLKVKGKAYYETHREEIKAKVKAQYDRSKYGLTPTARQEMYERQHGKCAICGTEYPFEGFKGLHVDHDHRSNLVRELLCYNCNTGLGKFADSPERLRAAASYLAKHSAEKITSLPPPSFYEYV